MRGPPAAPSASPPAARDPGAAPRAEPRAAAPASTSIAPPQTIRIGYPNRSVFFLPMLMAKDYGYFQEQGLNAELTLTRTNAGIAALLSGALDYTASFGTNIRSALRGAPVKTIFVGVRAPVFILVVRPELTSAPELRGRTFGVPNFGGSGDRVLRLILKHYMLDAERDVQILAVGDGPVQYEALRQGTIDAAAMSLPWPLLARQDGFSLIVNAAEIINRPVAGLGTTQSKIESQRDEVKRTLKAHIQALRHLRTQQTDAIRLIADLFDIDQNTAAQAFALIVPSFSRDGTVEREGIETVVELAREGDAAVTATFEQLVDTSVAADARRELGLR